MPESSSFERPQDNALTYAPETAFDFFESLQKAISHAPDYRATYSDYARIFHLCIDQQTESVRTNFVGPFAKTDYLLKEHEASPRIRRNTNETRLRLKRRAALKAEEYERFYLHDLKHLAEFVALVFSVPVPSSLSTLFPDDLTHTSHEVINDCMRAIVESWDDLYVTCRIDGYRDSTPVKVKYVADNESCDWKYLSRMFYEGAQINLVHPHHNDGVISAELIIFEPDYLVDISAIARCFEKYAESPYVNLVKKLQPSVATEAIVLGNFAGQLLDEELHQLPADHTYAQSVKEFFKTNAINLLTADVSRDFHTNAAIQQKNIRAAIQTELPQLLSRFDPRECIVEPSFFCEMLGVQGRMDMVQLDYRVLLEQKAGKGEFPFDNFIRPRHQEPHYVQLLLYMAVLRYAFRDVYEANNRELHAFLLYSKYNESLLGLGYAPELLYRAIKVRNGLAWTEQQFANNEGLRILERLTPEMLNQKHFSGPLWDRYTRPQLEQLLSPIHQVPELEREYYFRFLTFIANEHMLSKLGNKTKENSGFAAKWHNSLDEKLQAGNIYDRLHLVSPDASTEGNIESVTFSFCETADYGMSNFRKGDIVAFYPYAHDSEPDIRRAMVFRGSISEITPSSITIQLRAAQTNALVFLRSAERPWAIEHDFMESSYGSMYRGMHAFLSAPQDRRDLLMMRRPPHTTPGRQLHHDFKAFSDLAQRVKAADELFLIIGPPGTGKTSFGMLNTLLEELSEPESAVLLLSFTNRAVDEICSKLLETGIDFLRIGRSFNTPDAYQPFLLEQRLQQCNNLDQLRQLIASSRVVVATTTSINSNIALLSLKHFSLAIIDEASQILEPDLVGIFSAHSDGQPAIKKFVLIGDHKQLPAVVQQKSDVSRITSQLLLDIGLTNCRNSLFERMLWRYADDPSVTFMLTRQGRMHPDIASFVNEAFYGQRLGIVPLPHQQEKLTPPAEAETLPCTGRNSIDAILESRRLAFVNTVLPENSPSDKVNPVEAEMIAATVARIYELNADVFDPLSTVGVIVPYRNQIAAVRDALAAYGINALLNISIDTVERYQGSQRDYIIYGFTIQKHYQLNFLTDNVFVDTDGTIVDRKLNVALTRAKRHLILMGHAPLIETNPTFAYLLRFIRNNGGLFSIAPADYVAGQFSIEPTYEV